MLPEAGAFEIVFLAAVALIVVGPKDLPMLLRRVGQFTAKMRGLAAEFRASFDEMARQSELDELRKEVDALRNGQLASGATAELNSHVGEINAHLSQTSQPSQNYWDASSQGDPVQTFIDPQTGLMIGEGEETAALPPPGARTKPLATKTPRKLAAAAKVAAEPAPSAAEAETVAAPAAKLARKRVAKADKSSNPPGGSPAPADEAAGA